MRRPILRGLVLTAGGAAAVAAVSLCRNYMLAHLMGAAAFGLWNFGSAVVRLAVESHLGVLAALAVEAPVHRGAGRLDEALRVERRAAGGTLTLAVLAGLAAGAALTVVGGSALWFASAAMATTIVFQQLFNLDVTTLRSRGVFGRVAGSQVVFAVVHLAGLAILLRERYLTGALIAWSAAYLAAVLWMRVGAAAPLSPPIPGAVDAQLVRRGMPTYLIGLAFVLLVQVDRFVVGGMLGAVDLGLYGMLTLAGSALLLLPDALGSVLLTHAGHRYGAAGDDPAALSSLAPRSLRLLALALGPVLVCALWGTDFIVAWKLQEYADSLTALRPYLVGMFAVSLALPLRNLLVTVGAGRDALVAIGTALAATAILEAAAAATGFGILGVAAASAAASVGLLVQLFRLAVRHRALSNRDALRCVGEAFAIVVGAMALDALLRPQWSY